MPHAKYNEGKVEKHKLGIQEIFAILNAPSSNVNGRDPHFATVHPHTATTSAPESSTPLSPPSPISYGVLIAPRLFPRSQLQQSSLYAFGQACVRSGRTPLPDRGALLEQE
jgi:hypothetical protein